MKEMLQMYDAAEFWVINLPFIPQLLILGVVIVPTAFVFAKAITIAVDWAFVKFGEHFANAASPAALGSVRASPDCTLNSESGL